jgi:hypothetical protein
MYVHYTGFLNYTYRKYRVKSSFELKALWKEYDYYRYVTTRYSNLRNLSFAVEDDLHAFLKTKDLHRTKTSVETFERILDFESCRKQFTRFTNQLALINAKLGALESDQRVVWSELDAIKNRDTKDKVIERMMSEYFDDVSKVMPIADEEDVFDYEDGTTQNAL